MPDREEVKEDRLDSAISGEFVGSCLNAVPKTESRYQKQRGRVRIRGGSHCGSQVGFAGMNFKLD